MYEMNMDGKTFFAPANEKYTFIEFVMHEALNDAGYIEAQVPYTNPLFSEIIPGKSKVEVLKDGKSRFYGKIQDVKKDFANTKRLYIVGELSFINETVQMQQIVNGLTKSQLLTRLLNAHNAQSEEKFYPGVVSVSNTGIDALLDYGYTLDIIRDVICGDDGFIRITRRNGRREVDIVPIEAYGKQSGQYIRFGSNLLDYVENNTGSEIVTAILPRGKKLEGETEVEGLDSYLSIAAVNGGSPILVNQQASSTYGYRCKIVDFDTDDINTLLRLSKAYLTDNQYAGVSLELKAVDLSDVDSSQDDFEMGDYVQAICEPLDMATWFPVRKKDTNILDLAQNVINLGRTSSRSLTQATTSSLNGITQAIPQEVSILNQAKNDATKQIVEATTGVVTYRPNEMTISDNADVKKAIKIWRWNIGGFGYSRNGYNGPYETAMTMDGGFVANFIKTGEMSADRVRGGTFVVGGSGLGKDGEIVGYDAKDSEIFKLNKNGGWFRGDISAARLGGGAGNTLEYALQLANEAIQKAQEAADKADRAAQTAQSTANGAQTTASNAGTAASAAQSTANGAASAASAAQGTANGAVSAIADLKTGSVTATWLKANNLTGGTIYIGNRPIQTGQIKVDGVTYHVLTLGGGRD